MTTSAIKEPRSTNDAVDTRITSCRIYPGIGIARVGNSPEGWFYAPEIPGQPNHPEGGYKDSEGRLKRQGARFRIYGYNAKGEVVKEITADNAEITWEVHLANKKASYYQFGSHYLPRLPLRNPWTVGSNPDDPDTRTQLIIDPGARRITGRHQHGVRFDGGMFAPVSAPKCISKPVEVPLGELRTDGEGRLVVLGGHGVSAPTVAGNLVSDYANNDFWYDDTSDGPVTATVVLHEGKISLVAEPARVLVTPPKFAPDVFSVVTLYDVFYERAIDKGWIKPHEQVSFTRDIYPVFERLVNLQWVNATAYRGHGPGAPGDLLGDQLLPQLASNAKATEHLRQRVFHRIRNPNLPAVEPTGAAAQDPAVQKAWREAVEQANYTYMPPFAGDGGDPYVGVPKRWQRIMPRQYAALEKWARGEFVADWKPAPRTTRTFADIKLDEQPDALDRASLEPCVGGPFYPGIEITWVARYPGAHGVPDVYTSKFRLDPKLKPGDITRFMAVPWQADFNECNTHWWAAQRPDQIVTEELYQRVLGDLHAAGKLGSEKLAAMLAERTRWTRGIRDYTTDPNSPENNSVIDMDMITYWHKMGFVVQKTAPNGEIVHIETERDPNFSMVYPAVADVPYTGMKKRDFFHILLDIENHPDFLPKARELADEYLRTAWDQRDDPSNMGQLSFFEYSPEALRARLNLTYNALVADTSAYNPAKDPHYRTREDVIERIFQMAPTNLLDGVWLRNAGRGGPIDGVRSLLFSIYADETGNGQVSYNHCNLYGTLLESLDLFLPPIQSKAFADNPDFLDEAFDIPIFMLVMSQFTEDYFPEILGMTLEFEWSVIDYKNQIALMKFFGLDPHFYELHVGIDNADNGHGALALQAVELYLDGIRASDGEEAMKQAWYRVWRGYVGFALTGSLGAALIDLLVDPGPTLHEQVAALITEKKPYAQLNHGNLTVGPTRINNWFDDPEGFMRALIAAGYVVPGKPDDSPFFRLVSFDGPMFRVFTDAEITLWRDWTNWLATPEAKQAMEEEARTAKRKASNALPAPPVSACAEPAAAAAPSGPPPYDPIRPMIAVLRRMKEHQQGVSGHHVMLRGPDPAAPDKMIARPIKWWFDQVEDTGDAGALALMAALSHEDNGWVVKYDSARSPLVQNLMAGTGDMAQTLQRIAPDTLPMTPLQIAVALGVPPHLRPDDSAYTDDDGTVTSSGLTSVEVVAIWIDAGCPLGAHVAALGAVGSTRPPMESGARAQPSYVLRRRKRGMGSVH